MTMLYVGGHCVGRLPENANLLVELLRGGDRVELRDETGLRIGRLVPENEPLVPWDPSLTEEDLDRIASEPGLTLEELKKQLGW